MMKITAFGASGSIPAPSRSNFMRMEYGGNTSCYFVEAGPFRVILDFGSGSAVLGDHMMTMLKGKPASYIGLISHQHWDHIQGMPFMVPMFVPGNVFHLHGHIPPSRQVPSLKQDLETLLAEQQATPKFPVALSAMGSERYYNEHQAQSSSTFYYRYNMDGAYTKVGGVNWKDGGTDPNLIKITTIPLNHPDGCLGYLIEYMGKKIAYCTDNEPFRFTNHRINTIAAGADLLIADGQYTEQQLQTGAQGFGHGSPMACLYQALDAKAKRLLVHHFDQKNDDEALGDMEMDMLTKYLEYKDHKNQGVLAEVGFVREGMVYEV